MLNVELEPVSLENVLEKPIFRTDHLFSLYSVFRQSVQDFEGNVPGAADSFHNILIRLDQDARKEFERVFQQVHDRAESVKKGLDAFDLDALLQYRIGEWVSNGALQNVGNYKPYEDYPHQGLAEQLAMRIDHFVQNRLTNIRQSHQIVHSSGDAKIATFIEKAKSLCDDILAYREILGGEVGPLLNESSRHEAHQKIDGIIEDTIRALPPIVFKARIAKIAPYTDGTRIITSKEGTYFASWWKQACVEGFKNRQESDFNQVHGAKLSALQASYTPSYVSPSEEPHVSLLWQGNRLPSLVMEYHGDKVGPLHAEHNFLVSTTDFNLCEAIPVQSSSGGYDLVHLFRNFLAYRDVLRQLDLDCHKKTVPVYSSRDGFVARLYNRITGRTLQKQTGSYTTLT